MSYDDYDQDAAEARFDDEMAQLERIAELESLVRDVWAAYSEKAESSFHPAWEVDDELAERMTALGLLDGDAE